MLHKTFIGLFVVLGLLIASPLWAAGGGSSYSYGSSDKLEDAQEAIAAENYPRAIKYLKKAEKQDRYDADIQNLLGYSYRKLGDFDRSKTHYDKALRLDPNHLGAHEYMGELYLKLDQPQEAQRMLKRLKVLCGSCEEYQQLKTAYDGYEKKKGGG